MTDHTPTPWKLCGDGKCSCLTISCPDHPIAKVESGEWGDEYPAMRQVGPSLDNRYEAYMERIGYGTIDLDTAHANAAFIVKAVNSHDALVKALEVLLEEATSFSVSGVYFDEDCMGHKGPSLARAVLASVGGS